MAQKDFDPEDPLELVVVELSGGDTDQVIDGIALEYMLMGWSQARVMSLFRSPTFVATHQIYKLRGHDYVKQRISALAEEWNRGRIMGGESNAQGV